MNKSLSGKAILIIFLALGLNFACSKQDDAPSPSKPVSDAALPANDVNSSTNSDNLKPQQQQPSSTPEPTDKPVVASSEPVMPANTEELPTANQDKLALAKKSGCLVCHSVEKKIVGPAWRDVSKRYKDVPDAKKRLITKVAKGGSGNWKDVVGAAAMPPYSPRVSDENIAQLVEFVLSLEK